MDLVGTLITTLGLVAVAFINGRLAVRTERADALAEADLLAKLEPDSEEAAQLRAVIKARIHNWHGRFYKETPGLAGTRLGTFDVSWLSVIVNAAVTLVLLVSVIAALVQAYR